MNIDILIYLIGAFMMAGICIGFVAWGFKSGQFADNGHLKRKPLEEDEEE